MRLNLLIQLLNRDLSNVALDMVGLSRSIANRVVADGYSRPLCITERSMGVQSSFCQYFYEAYQELHGNNAMVKAEQVVQSVNLSYPGAMENEFMAILRRLYEDGAYEPDSYITFSEYVFSIINSVSLVALMSSISCQQFVCLANDQGLSQQQHHVCLHCRRAL